MNDHDPIRDKLQQWKVELAASRNFNAEVWAKIGRRKEAREATGWTAFVEWLFPSRTAWQLAAITAAIFIAAGAGLGGVAGVASKAQGRAELAFRYAQSIDPYLQVTTAHAK